MITCPVCEHTQAAGDECENCGKRLVAARGVVAPVERLPELELTPLVRPGLPVSAERLPDLEATRQHVGPDLPAMVVPELERTATAPTGALPIQVLPELDLGRSEDDGIRTAAPTGAITCRYCRNVQASGLLCDKCGMKLPVFAPVAAAPAKPAAPAGPRPRRDPDVPWRRCGKCGSPAKAGERCGNCGQPVPPPEGR